MGVCVVGRLRACATGALLVALGAANAWAEPRDCLVVETGAGDTLLTVEVVSTPEAMAQGLMWRTSLAEDRGMLFVYESPRHVSFWMKNTLIPLDIVFIDADGRVRRIAYGAQPLSLESVRSGAPVRYVLEIAAGVADKIGLRPGDRVYHPDVGDSRRLRRVPLPDRCR